MKKFGILFAGALAFFALASCNDDLEVAPNESYYASVATITSSDSNVTITGNEAEVTFKVEGGTVTFTVDCGCEWKATSYKPEYFTATTTSTSVTITAVQNTVENELAGVVSLMTAGKGIQFARIQVYQNAYGAPEITVSSNEWNAPAVGALTTEISVTASDEWDIENTAEWLTVEKTGTGISLAAAENEETEERTAKVVLTCTDGIHSDSETITVTQDGKAYITLSEESVSFSSDGASATVTVESNFDWDYSYDTSNGWLTVTRNGDVLTVTASANDSGDDREETITFTAGDGAENVTESLLSVTQESYNPMILTYKISSANTTTQLPLYGTVDCTIDWGDGSEIESVTILQPVHTYATAGEYDITINGTVTALYSENISKSSAPLPIIAVKSWGQTGLTNMEYAFNYCTNLVSLPEESGDAFSEVTSFEGVFYYCQNLKTIPKGLFDSCTKATSFDMAFFWTAVETIPTGLFDNCIEALNFHSAFYYTSVSEIPKGLFDFCTKVKNFQYVFTRCPITEIPEGLFDNCTEVTDFSFAFTLCSSLTTVPKGLFDNCPNVETFASTFSSCSKLTSIPERLFDKCTEVTSFNSTFKTCSTLTSIPEGLFDNCPSVETFASTFGSCSSLTTVPKGLFDNCPNVETFASTFVSCDYLTSIPEKLFAKNLKVTSFASTFNGDLSLTGESPYDLIMVNGVETKVHLYERENYPDIYVTPTSHSSCFKNCIGLSDYSSIISGWK